MKKSKFTDSQIMEAIKRGEAGLTVTDICRELGISTALFYRWRAKYGGMDTAMIARLKELEAENAARLKKMYAEERLKSDILKEAMAKNGEAISPTRDGRKSSGRAGDFDQAGLRDLQGERDLLSLCGQAEPGE
jgi:putative transposase